MKIKIFISILLIATITWVILKNNNSLAENTSTRDVIREARIKACATAYWEYKERITERYIHTDQNWIIRCFSFMSLTYAFETWYWKSNMCINNKNCFWIKEPTYKWVLNWINYRVWNWRFLILDNFDDWNLLYARLYARWHLNKTIDTYIYDWSMTDREVYIWYMKDNYWHFYNEGMKIASNKINNNK